MRARGYFAFCLLFITIPVLAAVTGTVMTSEGQPIAGATISAYAYEPFDAWYERINSSKPERTAVASVKTDGSGRFSIELPKDAFEQIRVEAAGFAPQSQRTERN